MANLGYAQLLSPVSRLPLPADKYIGFDGFGFNYYTSNNTFVKQKDGLTLEYNNLSLGAISHADIINPLQIALFYANFNTVVLLDNQLNEIRQIRFSELALPIVVAATGNAALNRLWIFNSLTRELGFYDYSRNEFSKLTQPLQGIILHYETNFNSFEWVDENHQRFSCDIFGKITNLGEVPNFDSIKFVSNKALIYVEGNKVMYRSQSSDEILLLDLVQNSFRSLYYKDQILSIFTTDGITNYKIATP